ncbi:GGDEF domain-containing protein [Natronospirillum operosum]|uniref:diguanylate cyclase n=1 Tax=Natronospirillum operosum TaxID=2759953 RepID=A0A4Z0WFY6_9GAMM|nr:GGDEF domain-containing protein [Natronospirillum operosum]TGG95940.1 GGDEF domain-containing protein [Natronospirillum operosum]
MPILALLPVLCLALVQAFWPDHAFYQAMPFPATAFTAMALVALIATLMRQTEWLYWLAILGGHYWATQNGLQRPLSEPDVAALHQLLPLTASLLMLALSALPKPGLPSIAGVLVLGLCFLLPASLVWLPLADWLAASGLPPALFERPVEGFFMSWAHLWWFSGLLFLWLGLISFRPQDPSVWGQFSTWLAILLFYAFMDRQQISGWATLAGSMALLITLAYRMLHLAYMDELTALPQRRALENRLRRLGRNSAVTMLDVDHFKSFNDTWGHDVGDQVLKLLGAILGRQRGMQAFRYGGEEFTLVFSHARKKAIRDALEAVRAEVEAYPLQLRQDDRPNDSEDGRRQRGSNDGTTETVNITISLGCALRQPGETPQTLLKRADEALYKAKNAGRNCVRIVS